MDDIKASDIYIHGLWFKVVDLFLRRVEKLRCYCLSFCYSRG